MNDWRLLKQDFVNNIGIELLELEDEKEGNKKFVSLTKYEKIKSIVIPIEKIEEIAEKMKRLKEEE